ncbi:ABC transporter permease subunit [Actinomadura formosensis]|uniref:ABC transporter permease subunit n=1 Tax=Actinomadura formosensis TaxID=60706 RepID=UPI0008346ECC|nr:ABC transporter permease subunit [Actinomadura formosensis]
MIWLTLRQFRVQAAVVFGGLAALGAVLAITGPGISDGYHSGLAACGTRENCSQFTARFFNDHRSYFGALAVIVMSVPGIIGVFWGAPLITRELESGTHRLVWNQSITRTRWLAVKLGVIGLAAMAAAGLAVLAATWWSGPLDEAAHDRFPRITPLMFDARGITPIGYAAFAFALGVTVGVLVRRTLPAMAITLVVFVAVQIAMPTWIRPHLIPPETGTVPITSENHGDILLNGDAFSVQVRGVPGAWTLSAETVDASGRTVGDMPTSLAAGPCAPPPPSADGGPPMGPAQACFDAIAELGYRGKVVYQPGDHFWPLQWAETGLFTALSLGLAGFCFFWTRRRLS